MRPCTNMSQKKETRLFKSCANEINDKYVMYNSILSFVQRFIKHSPELTYSTCLS